MFGHHVSLFEGWSWVAISRYHTSSLRTQLPAGAGGVEGQEESRILGLPWWSSGEESALQCGGLGFHPWYGS